MKKRTLALLLAVTCLLGLMLTACPAPGDEGVLPPVTVSFSGDFTVAGEGAAALTAALAENGIPLGQTGAAKTIYINASEGALATAARAKLNERALNYADYVILSNTTKLAIAAASDYATEAAIASLISTYKAEGALKMPKDLSLHHCPALSGTTVNGTPLTEYTVTYYDDAIAPIAEQLSNTLAPVIGKRLTVEKNAETRNLLILDADDMMATEVSRNLAIESYTLDVATSYAAISTPNPVLLSYAISAFAGTVKAGTALTAASSGEQAITLSAVKATDASLFKYTGTWQETMPDKHPDTMISYWNVSSVEIDFYGPVITLTFPETTAFIYSIDGGQENTVANVKGQITLFAGESGKHTLRISSKSADTRIFFGGAVIEENMTLTRAKNRAHYVQFVGDSIVASQYSYPYTAHAGLGWDIAAAARAGIALTMPDNNPDFFYSHDINAAMEDAFFSTGMPEHIAHLYSPTDVAAGTHIQNYNNGLHQIDYSQMGYTPDIVFLAIGINDHLSQRSTNYDYTEKFIDHYIAFVEKIFATYGANTDIVIMSALNEAGSSTISRFTNAVWEVANSLQSTYGERIHFIDYEETTSWTDIEFSNDGVHPSTAGYATLSEHVYNWLLAEFPN